MILSRSSFINLAKIKISTVQRTEEIKADHPNTSPVPSVTFAFPIVIDNFAIALREKY